LKEEKLLRDHDPARACCFLYCSGLGQNAKIRVGAALPEIYIFRNKEQGGKGKMLV